MPDEQVRIDRRVLAGIEAHARDAAPDECCGLLVARDGVIREAAAVANQADEPRRRYEIAPADYLEAVRRGRTTGGSVVGAYHSHPRSLPEPSPTDLESAFTGFVYLIAGPASGPEPLQVRAYRLVDGNFRELRLVPEPEEPRT